MNLRTQSDWEVKNPGFNAFSNPKNPSFMWRAVELTLSVYYYHVNLNSDPDDLDSCGSTLIVSDFFDALQMLLHFKGSTLSLQTPEWRNNGKPGLYRVVSLHQSSGSKPLKYIAKCDNNKMHILDFNHESLKVDPANLAMSPIWKSPRKKRSKSCHTDNEDNQ